MSYETTGNSDRQLVSVLSSDAGNRPRLIPLAAEHASGYRGLDAEPISPPTWWEIHAGAAWPGRGRLHIARPLRGMISLATSTETLAGSGRV